MTSLSWGIRTDQIKADTGSRRERECWLMACKPWGIAAKICETRVNLGVSYPVF
jgi:hypothetical protein